MDSFQDILKRKREHYGNTEAAIEFAAEEFALCQKINEMDKKVENKQVIPAVSIPVHELFHIRHHEPVESGCVLSHDSARMLLHGGMVDTDNTGRYITTAKGRHVIEEMVNYLARLKVTSFDFPTVSINQKKNA